VDPNRIWAFEIPTPWGPIRATSQGLLTLSLLLVELIKLFGGVGQ
jgi:hypothetical protein